MNTYWAQVGERLGNETMFKYMDRFGFTADPELDYPGRPDGAERRLRRGPALGAGDAIDIGRVAIGQGGARAGLTTPLQMAEVAATIANGGVLMRPTFVQQVTDPDGRVTESSTRTSSRPWSARRAPPRWRR